MIPFRVYALFMGLLIGLVGGVFMAAVSCLTFYLIGGYNASQFRIVTVVCLVLFGLLGVVVSVRTLRRR